MVPFDIIKLLHDGLKKHRRPPDGLLHCSSDIVGSLRHAQLRAAGAPTIASELVSDVRMMTGTLWHKYIASILVDNGISFQQEVSVNEGLPLGWSGTADWLFYNNKLGGFVLGDLKTQKGEAMRWLEKDGVKEEHLYQLSAYFHALVDMDIPMVEGFVVLYLPMNDTPDKDERITPILMECDPIPRNILWDIMEERWELTLEYLNALPDIGASNFKLGKKYIRKSENEHLLYLNKNLVPVQERVQKVYKNKDKFEVKLVPHWSTKFCPFPNELCDCSEQGTTKIGEFTIEGYVPRNGYEEITLEVNPPKELANVR